MYSKNCEYFVWNITLKQLNTKGWGRLVKSIWNHSWFYWIFYLHQQKLLLKYSLLSVAAAMLNNLYVWRIFCKISQQTLSYIWGRMHRCVDPFILSRKVSISDSCNREVMLPGVVCVQVGAELWYLTTFRTFSTWWLDMGCIELAGRQDLFQHLANLDMRHILDHILSYLDMESIYKVEKVSPLWAWVVQSSSVVYKHKVRK